METSPGAAPPQTPDVLVVHADLHEAARLAGRIEKAGQGFTATPAQDLETSLPDLAAGRHAAVLVDVPADDPEPLSRLTAAALDVPVVALLAKTDEEAVLEALRLGAQECVAGPLGEDDRSHRRLHAALRRAAVRQQPLTALRRTARHHRHRASRDVVTGLPHRGQLLEQLQRSVAAAEQTGVPIGVLAVDLDRFEQINQALGTRVGDALLRNTARRLERLLRSSDMVARVGDDEFAVVLPGAGGDRELARVAEKVLANLAEPQILDDREYWLTATLGIAVFPRDAPDAEGVLRRAQTAMAEAKRGQGNHYRFSSEPIDSEARRRLGIERRLRKAFAEKRLQIHYQPRVDLRSGLILGAEALMRWTDPELGPIAPADFIPIAEDAGMIGDISRYTLRAACEQAADWKHLGFTDLRVSVNVSPAEVRQDVLREEIVRALWDSGLSPKQLELEITEYTLMRPESVAVLQDLKQMGIGVSLDDFGTGFSSLSHLKQVPVDTVKIDRSFVSELTLDPDDEAIVEAILSIAEKLDLRVVAEGVETEGQRGFLSARGCDEMQGFLLSPAVPPERFLALLRRGPGRGDP